MRPSTKDSTNSICCTAAKCISRRGRATSERSRACDIVSGPSRRPRAPRRCRYRAHLARVGAPRHICPCPLDKRNVGAGTSRWPSPRLLRARAASSSTRTRRAAAAPADPRLPPGRRRLRAASQTEMASMLISREMFERHVECDRRSFRFVSLDEIGEHVASGVPSPSRRRHHVRRRVSGRLRARVPVPPAQGHPGGHVRRHRSDRPAGLQTHDRLYYLVDKAFTAWDDPGAGSST